MDNEKLMHDLIVDRLRGRFLKEYGEMKVNEEGRTLFLPIMGSLPLW